MNDPFPMVLDDPRAAGRRDDEEVIGAIDALLGDIWGQYRFHAASVRMTIRLFTTINRRIMTKRRFRRWHGRLRQRLRSERSARP